MRAYLLLIVVMLIAAEVYFERGASFDQSAYRKAWLSQILHAGSAIPRPVHVQWRREWISVDAASLRDHLDRIPGWPVQFFGLVMGCLLFGSAVAGTTCAAVPALFGFDRTDDAHRRGAFLLDSRVPAIFCGRFRVAWMLGAGLALGWYFLAEWFGAGFQLRALPALVVGYGLGFSGVLLWTRMKRAGPSALQLGNVSIPAVVELYHFLLAGRTGAGKTQAIQQLLRPVRARGDRALVADPDGGYLSRFGESADLILNPFDRRSVRWSPFAEIHAPFDYDVLAHAAVPQGNTANEEEWRRFGRVLLSATLKRLHEDGRCSAREVLHIINAARDDELQTMLAGTNAAGLRRHDAMFHSILGVVTPHIQSWEYLPEPDEQSPPFSIREWVQRGDRGWLFLPYRDDQLDSLKHLIATWVGLAVTEGLSLPENLDRRLWFVIDELDSLGKVSSLRLATTKLRKHGGVMVAGLQTIAQLRATYGYDEAQVILSSLANKLILAVGDHETARYFQDELGQREIERWRVSRQSGRNWHHSTHSITESTEVALEHLVLASELQGLPERRGYLRRAGDTLIYPVRIPLVPMPARITPFVRAE
jgi:hypothetical protein